MRRATSALLAVALAVGGGLAVFQTMRADAGHFNGTVNGNPSSSTGGSGGSCGETDSCAAVSYVATTTDGGPAFTATGAGIAVKGPGSNATVEFTADGETHLCPANSTNCTVQMGAGFRVAGGDIINTNGQLILNNNAKLVNQYKHINLGGAHGVNSTVVTTLDTCDAALNMDADGNPGVTVVYYRSAGAAERRCECLRQSDGTSYAWVSSGGTGTSTSCP